MVGVVWSGSASGPFMLRCTSGGPPTVHTRRGTRSTATHDRPTPITLGESTRSVTWTRKLSPESEAELISEYRDGWTVKELTIIYRVSERTVYRLLAEYRVPRHATKGARRKRKKTSKPRELKPCGTNAAYHRHRRNGEYPCAPCLEAHAQNVKEAKNASTKRPV